MSQPPPPARFTAEIILSLALLTTVFAAAAFARHAVNPLQETITTALSLTDNQMAMLQGPALSLPMMLAAIPLGIIADRYSRVRLLLLFAIFTVIGSVATALAPGFAVFFMTRCLIGLTTAINPIVISLAADLYAPAQRGRAYMVLSAGQVAAMSAVFAVGGWLVSGDHDPDIWRDALLWLTLPSIIGIGLILIMREPPRREVRVQNPTFRQALTELWHLKGLIAPVTAGIVIIEIALGAAVIWTAPTLARGFDLAPDRVGAIMAASLLASGLLGPAIGGTLADWCQRTGGPRRTIFMLGVIALITIPCGLFAILPHLIGAAVLFTVFKSLVSGLIVMAMTLFTVVIPNELRGLCIGILVAATVLFSGVLGPPVVSALSGVLGGGAMIGTALTIVCVVTCLIGAVIFFHGRKFLPAQGST